MARAPERDLPLGSPDERELLLAWLAWLREAVLGKVDGLSEDGARWTPEGRLIPLLGIVNHLTHLEWRWIDGTMRGEDTSRQDEEFFPGPELTVAKAVEGYRARAAATELYVRATALTQPTLDAVGTDLRFVLLHLINETARHAGHADATRELLDGLVGE
jgi:uncharacterized damage-inducible protein DinB